MAHCTGSDLVVRLGQVQEASLSVSFTATKADVHAGSFDGHPLPQLVLLGQQRLAVGLQTSTGFVVRVASLGAGPSFSRWGDAVAVDGNTAHGADTLFHLFPVTAERLVLSHTSALYVTTCILNVAADDSASSACTGASTAWQQADSPHPSQSKQHSAHAHTHT